MKKAVILGATGAVGKEILKELIRKNKYDKIYVVGRSSIEKIPNHDKLEKVIINFDKMEVDTNILDAADVFVAFGTTLKQAGSKEEQFKIDYTYIVNFAVLCDKKVKSFNIVSSMGADSKSKNFYLATKGKVEDKLSEFDLSYLRIYRPSLLVADRKGRFLESIGMKLVPLLKILTRGKLIDYSPIKVDELAKIMVANVVNERKGRIYTYSNFNK